MVRQGEGGGRPEQDLLIQDLKDQWTQLKGDGGEGPKTDSRVCIIYTSLANPEDSFITGTAYPCTFLCLNSEA